MDLENKSDVHYLSDRGECSPSLENLENMSESSDLHCSSTDGEDVSNLVDEVESSDNVGGGANGSHDSADNGGA